MSAEQPIPRGYCQCGCGQRTPPQRQTSTARGFVKGEPCPYVPEHKFRRPPPAEGTHYELEDRGFTTPCWVWKRAKTRGYGVLCRGGRLFYAHRWMYERFVGQIPEGLHLDHLCRVPLCVNPEHLEPVTSAENSRRGETSPLDHAAVRAIRSSSEPRRVLADRYGVAPNTITNIRARRRWADAA